MLIVLGVGLHLMLVVALGALGFKLLCILVSASLFGSGALLCTGPLRESVSYTSFSCNYSYYTGALLLWWSSGAEGGRSLI